MYKALLKKQFMEMNAYLFQNKKTGKARTKASLVGFVLLYGVIFLFLAGTFFGLAMLIGGDIANTEFAWFLFTFMGMIAIALGTFGSVFNTYATLYLAKDNELLLSMPIPPLKLLSVKLIGTFAMGLLYEGIVWLPTCVAYWIAVGETGSLTFAKVLLPLLLTLVIGLFVLVLTCLLGWVVAMITSKLRNKNILTLIISLVFLGGYYVVYFRLVNSLNNLVLNIDDISSKVKGPLFPFYHMGLAATGSWLSFLGFTVAMIALAVLTCYVMASNFTKIVTANVGVKRVKYVEKRAKATSQSSALLRKEFKRFTGSATYMLNCGLGSVFLLAGAVYLVIRRSYVLSTLEMFGEILPEMQNFLPAILAIALSFLISTNAITAPSISLEGRNIWQLKALPISVKDVFAAKKKVHYYITGIPTLIAVLAFCYCCGLSPVDSLLLILFAVVYLMFSATSGLAAGLRFPNMKWTDETMVIKRGAPVFISLFGGWAIGTVIGLGLYFGRKFISARLMMVVMIVLFLAADLLIDRWMNTKGIDRFMEL